jgi:hypothetical protein
MTISSKPVYGVTGEKPSQDIGVFIKRGGVVLSAGTNNLDKNLYDSKGNPQFFKFLQVGTGGSLVYLTAENQPNAFISVPDGAILPCHGYQVLSSAPINTYDAAGNIVSTEIIATSAFNITWHGGE